ncbi:MAG: flagellar biosynthesis repressor FlbT [Pseudomonadota bacterium]
MALKVELKPGERIIVGDCVITNDKQRTRLFIEGTAPILREKDILTPDTADTPAKRVYLCVQMMYIDKNIDKHADMFLELARDFLNASPSSSEVVERINNKILTGELYKALREAKALISLEEDRLNYVQLGGSSILEDLQRDGATAGT